MNEILSPSWATVRLYAEGRLQELREQLERPTPTREQDLITKGEIRALKKLLDLPAELAAQQSQNAAPNPQWFGADDS